VSPLPHLSSATLHNPLELQAYFLTTVTRLTATILHAKTWNANFGRNHNPSFIACHGKDRQVCQESELRRDVPSQIVSGQEKFECVQVSMPSSDGIVDEIVIDQIEYEKFAQQS
jgi:hypothetical protein